MIPDNINVMKPIITSLLKSKMLKHGNSDNNFFQKVAFLAFYLKLITLPLLIWIFYDITFQISYYFVIPTFLLYFFLTIWCPSRLEKESLDVSIPVLEIMLFFIVFEILFILINLINFSKWVSLLSLWIVLPFHFYIIIGTCMRGPYIKKILLKNYLFLENQ